MAVEPVLSRLPENVKSPLEVRQYRLRWMDVLQVDLKDTSNDFPYLGEDIRTGLWWGRGAGSLETESYPLGLSLGVGAWAVGLPTTPSVTNDIDSRSSDACKVAGQARGIVAVWLAGQASDTAHQHIHNVFDEYETRFPRRFEETNGWIGDHQPYSWYRSAFTLAHSATQISCFTDPSTRCLY